MFRLICVLVLLPSFAIAQPMIIDWSLPVKRQINPSKILPDSALTFYTEHQSAGQMFQNGMISHFVNGDLISTSKIPTTIDNNVMTLEHIEHFGSHLIGFYSDRQAGSQKLFLQEFDSELFPIGAPVLLNEFSTRGGAGSRGYYNFILSPGKNFLCAEYVIPGKKNVRDRLGYSILSTDLKITTFGEYEVPFDTRFCVVDNRSISEQGEYLVTVSEFTATRSGFFRDYSNISRTILTWCYGNEVHEFDLVVPEGKIYDVGVRTQKDIIIVTGTYGSPGQESASGVFVQKINSTSRKLVATSFTPFPADIQAPDNVSFAYPIGEPSISQQRSELLKNYAIRDVYAQEDGSLVVMAEQYFIYQQSVSDMRGLYNVVNHYYFDDILAFRLDSSGVFQWVIEIPKEQYSLNDNAYFSSFRSVVSGNQILCFFNDARQNYSETGNFNNSDSGIGFPVRRTWYALALARIDLSTGTYTREMLNDYDQAGGVVAMSLTVNNPGKRQLLFYSAGNNEQFGLFRY